jgi:hypothetical protein
MATEDYIAVTGDDWYERRRKDAAGKFWLSVAQQGPMKDVATKQGIYFLTAGGKLLHSKNAGQNVEVMREALKQGLREWKKLPDADRAPGAVKIEELTAVDKEYVRTPPPGGLILDVYVRMLDKSTGTDSGLCNACAHMKAGKPIQIESQRDHLWLTKAEWQSLIPKNVKPGDSIPISQEIAHRIFRFHLVDSTRGQPPMWKKNELLKGEMTLKVESVKDGKTDMILEGSALLSSDPDTTKAKRGFDVVLLGKLSYNEAKNAFERFDLIALGEHWGEGQYTPGARLGRTPLGLAFELARVDDPASAVPPEGARNWWEYMNAK